METTLLVGYAVFEDFWFDKMGWYKGFTISLNHFEAVGGLYSAVGINISTFLGDDFSLLWGCLEFAELCKVPSILAV